MPDTIPMVTTEAAPPPSRERAVLGVFAVLAAAATWIGLMSWLFVEVATKLGTLAAVCAPLVVHGALALLFVSGAMISVRPLSSGLHDL